MANCVPLLHAWHYCTLILENAPYILVEISLLEKKSEICDRKLGRPRTPIFYGNLTASVYRARSLDSVRLAKLRYSLLKQKIWPIIFSFLLWLTALDYYSGNVGSAVNSAASTVHPWAIQSCLCFLVEKVAGILPWPTWAPLGVLLQW